MINEKLETFLEKADMNFLFCLLAQLEAYRLLQFPTYVRQKFEDKIAILAMNHVAENEVPDYITELAEAELAAAQEKIFMEEESAEEEAEETIDDSEKFIEELSDTESFEDEEDEEEEEEEEEEDFYDDNEDNEDNNEN
ncbi:MAG TPA: hypothetical protein PLE33_04205 [Candidatus Cloacimonas sp.]|nr:hypothetical protein [Candidatus Cloacimonas sp.]HPS60447.1 hypothetical protein [Candidatus Cloacimonas sp.]